MFCGVLSFNISDGDGFDDDGYYYGVGVGDEDGDFGWVGVVFCVIDALVTHLIYQQGFYEELLSIISEVLLSMIVSYLVLLVVFVMVIWW